MATSFTASFDEDGYEFSLDGGRKQQCPPDMQPNRVCDGCLEKIATEWHTFYPTGRPYFDSETVALENVALCATCKTEPNAIDDENGGEQEFSPALFSANRRRYESSDKWRATRTRILQRDEGICRLCLSSPAVAVHHLSYANYGNEFLYELIAVCHKCHLDWHDNVAAYYRERKNVIIGKRLHRFPALNKCTWRLSSHTATPLGTKSKGSTDANQDDSLPGPFSIREDIWYCECQSVVCYPHDGKAKRHMVANGCEQCGDFHKFGYYKRKPACVPVEIDQRILEFTNTRLDAYARNRFAGFCWHPAIQREIEASWPCKCSHMQNVVRFSGDGLSHYGQQCEQCGIFRDAKVDDASSPRHLRAYDPNITLAFRRSKYREHLDRLVDIEIEKLRSQKLSEAIKWLESGASRMQLNLDRVKQFLCLRCNASDPQCVWFRVMPQSDYFSCLDLAPFCDACYSRSVAEFISKWNPVPISLPLHGNTSSAIHEPQQKMLF